MDNIFPNLESAFGGKGQIKDITIKKYNVSEKIQYVEIDKLISFKNHIFSPISENKFQELKSSINQSGILVPIIIRKFSNQEFEIISGHNRVKACKELGYNTIPAIIKDVNDDEANLIMIDTNISQRDKLLPSELMKAYSIKQAILKSDQVGKNEDNSSGTCDTREKLAEQENTSATQISRYLRLKELIPELLELVDKEKIPFTVGVTLSFLKKEYQQILLEILNDNSKLKITLKQAEKLKTTKAPLTKEYILNLLNSKTTKNELKFTGRIKTPLVKKYKDKFNSDEEFTKLIEILLEKHFNSIKDLSDKNLT